MKRFKAVLLEGAGYPVPAWAAEILAQANVDFVAVECRSADDVRRHAADADLVWVWGGTLLTPEVLAFLPQCGAIIRTGSGTDNVPVAAATERGIVVANTPEAHNDAVSNHVIGLLFAVIRNLVVLDRRTRAGQWRPARIFPSGWHLHGQTLGLVGFGHISRLVAKKLSGFDVRTLVFDPFLAPEVISAAGAQPAALDDLLAQSDFVSLHCPLTPQTHHLIGERELQRMKPQAILINTARGPVVDEPALARALTEKWIAAAGLDVFEQEPPDPANPLFGMDNVVLTPHTAGESDEDRNLAYQLSVESVVAFAQGKFPRSYVNRGVKPRWPLA
ncbi:MAG: C-terminal binding protein [Anaerolineales bacterium]|nr:C-terminal binding protein [Anaerolineales bacterium]